MGIKKSACAFCLTTLHWSFNSTSASTAFTCVQTPHSANKMCNTAVPCSGTQSGYSCTEQSEEAGASLCTFPGNLERTDSGDQQMHYCTLCRASHTQRWWQAVHGGHMLFVLLKTLPLQGLTYMYMYVHACTQRTSGPSLLIAASLQRILEPNKLNPFAVLKTEILDSVKRT